MKKFRIIYANRLGLPDETVKASRFYVDGSFLLFVDEEYSSQPHLAVSAHAVVTVVEVQP